MITSADNTQVKNIIKLQKKKSERDKQGVFIVEGPKMLEEAPTDRLISVYVSETYARNKGLEEGDKVEIVRDSIFEKMSDTKSPQGILAIIRRKNISLDEIFEKKDKAFYILLENLRDPGNLGTIVRMAEAAGASGIILGKESVDIYNPKVVRATMGSIYRVKYAYCDDFILLLKSLENRGITSYAAALDGAKNYTDFAYEGLSALVIGNEARGLSKEAVDNCKYIVKIPMEGGVESLNAAIATTVMAFEIARLYRG